MKNHKLRNTFITLFVIFWTLIFHYESIRYFYLNPLFGKNLPKIKFLFPPAGWIMFFRVGDSFNYLEVYGIKDNVPNLIDPHQIFETRFFGFDNIHRGVLGAATDNPKDFCRYMERKFSYFDNFAVTVVHFPSLVKEPNRRQQRVIYQCAP